MKTRRHRKSASTFKTRKARRYYEEYAENLKEPQIRKMWEAVISVAVEDILGSKKRRAIDAHDYIFGNRSDLALTCLQVKRKEEFREMMKRKLDGAKRSRAVEQNVKTLPTINS